ncbi:putative fasciclin-like arabinogalactan protein 20 [Silene latifolia]|uniref:putative fasciclin-like arabinogalactan protein 20 n=1 Tax=Silene latifolia TaxID=37657 RepID=UPI003D777BF8
MASSISPLLSFLPPLLILLNTTIITAIPETTIASAAEILSNNNHNSISLTLPLISTTLNLPSLPSATLFAPADSVFSVSSPGQPSLPLLKFHFCPRLLTPGDLLSLPYGSQIPTLLSNSSLSITSTIFDNFVALNGIKITLQPLFYDPVFAVYDIDSFFSPTYWVDDSFSEFSPGPTYPTNECHFSAPASGVYWEAAAALRSRGYSRMAGFLDVQVSQFDGNNAITVFAPKDEAMEGYLGNYSDWGSVFLRHVIGCEMSWGDLAALNNNEVVLGTFLKGFEIKIEKTSEGFLVFNQNFTVNFPDFYRADRILVHGLSGVFTVPEVDNKPAGQEVSQGGSYTITPSVVLKTVSDDGEF